MKAFDKFVFDKILVNGTLRPSTMLGTGRFAPYEKRLPRKNFPVENSNDCGVFVALRGQASGCGIVVFNG